MIKENLKIVLLLVLFFSAISIPAIITYQTLHAKIELETSGVTATIGLELTYLNGTPQTTLNWGVVGNETKHQYSQLKNVANTAVTVLMTTNNTEPSYLSQSWNLTDNYPLQQNQQVIVEWTLTATDVHQGDSFSYTTTIMGTEF